MGKKLLIFLILLALLFVGYTKYNRMLTMEKTLTTQWSIIESEYQHKSDVIFEISENLSDTVEAKQSIVERVKQARNEAAKVKIDPDNISEAGLQVFRRAYQQLLDLQVELLQLTRQYPELSDNQVYRELVTELDGTEIRIANERRRMNEQVIIYNKYINGFFNIAIAQVLGFNDWPVFTPLLGE